MADSSNEQEKLKITAELDTSKLKQQAQQGMQAVVQEEKKVERQSEQTSKAVDKIGDTGKKVGSSLQQAGQSGTQSLKQVQQEADKTANKISDIDKAVKNLKLGQAIGLASRFANSDIGKGIGNAVGDSLGMSDEEKSRTGGIVQGALQGAGIGAMVGGPWGAVIGGLGGAAMSLLQAGEELKKAAKEGEDRWEETKRQSNERQETEQFNNTLRNGTRSELEERLKAEEKRIKDANANIADLRGQDAKVYKTESEYDYVTYETYERQVEDHAATAKKAAELTEKLTNAEKERADALAKQQAIVAEITRREAELAAKRKAAANLPVGPEIPDYLRAQRDAEANALVGPEIPDYLRAQRDAEEKEARKKQLDALNVQKNGLQDQIKDLTNFASGMAGKKLTDSLTQIGGGAGYGSQMRGIADHVSKVVNEIKNLNKTLEQINNKMDNIKGDSGVFVSETA